MQLPEEIISFALTLALPSEDGIEPTVALSGEDAWSAHLVIVLGSGAEANRERVDQLIALGFFGRARTVSDVRRDQWYAQHIAIERNQSGDDE